MFATIRRLLRRVSSSRYRGRIELAAGHNDIRDAEGNMPSTLAANHGFYDLAQAVREAGGASSTDSDAVGGVVY